MLVKSLNKFIPLTHEFTDMTEDKLDIKNIKSYWIAEAEEALNVTDHLFEKKDYSYALFFGHLAVEKMYERIHTRTNSNH